MEETAEMYLMNYAYGLEREATDKYVLKIGLDILSARLDDLLDICQLRQPTPQEIAKFRAYLPPSRRNAYPIKQTKGTNRE